MATDKPLEELLISDEERHTPPIPQLFDMRRIKDQQNLQALFTHLSVKIRDILNEQILELAILRNPDLSPLDTAFIDHYEKLRREIIGSGSTMEAGVWVYLPWKEVLVHLLPEELYFELRCAYNRELITTAEQQKLRRAHVAIAGLSGGNSAAISLVLQGSCRQMYLADTDTLAVGNTNRLRAGIDLVGEYKTHLTAQQIYELDPFSDLTLFHQGVTTENVKQFIGGPPKINILIDEVDNISAKLLMRREARRQRVPVISVVHNGDSLIIDLERYDLDPEQKLFNGFISEAEAERDSQGLSQQEQARTALQALSGRAGDIEAPFLRKKMDPQRQAYFIMSMIGKERLTQRMRESMTNLGKTIYATPQLGTSVATSGAVLAFLSRQLILGQPVPAGRYEVSLEKLFAEHF